MIPVVLHIYFSFIRNSSFYIFDEKNYSWLKRIELEILIDTLLFLFVARIELVKLKLWCLLVKNTRHGNIEYHSFRMGKT